MLFGRRKPGFIKVEDIDDKTLEKVKGEKPEVSTEVNLGNEDKPELTEFLASLPDVDDPYDGIEMEEEKEEVELTKAQELAEYIRIRSVAGELTKHSDLKAELEDLDILLEEIKEDETCSDITFKQGEKDKYYYSQKNMSDNYGMIMTLVEDKDLVSTVVKMVRFNAETYPSPTPVKYFERHPYFATEPQIERAWDLISRREEYSDIQRLTNNNDEDFLYSTKFLSYKYANSLAFYDVNDN